MKYVAFLRGINVGGKNKIKMETLREACAALGFENVRTYINSGNVIFETADGDEEEISARIEAAIEQEFALKIRVITRAIAEIKRLIENNPFDGAFENDKDLHVFFLNETLPDEKRELLLSNNNENEQFAVRGREIFCHLRAGVSDSLMSRDYIGKKLKVSATARNWRTVNKIAELLKS